MEWILGGFSVFALGFVGLVLKRKNGVKKTPMDHMVESLEPVAKRVGPALRLHKYEGSVTEAISAYLRLTRGIQPENFSAKELHRQLQQMNLFPHMTVRQVQSLLDHALPVSRHVPSRAKTPRQRRRLARYTVPVF